VASRGRPRGPVCPSRSGVAEATTRIVGKHVNLIQSRIEDLTAKVPTKRGGGRVPEGTNIEVAQTLTEFETGAKKAARHHRVEILEAIVLALVALATAWSGLQSARWDGHQAVLSGTSVKLRVEAVGAFTEGTEARTVAERYVRVTVFLATVLFLIALSQRFYSSKVRVGLLAVAALLLTASLVSLATYPRL